MQLQSSGSLYTPHQGVRTVTTTCDAAAVISVGRFDPLYGFMQNRGRLCARPRARSILSRRGEKRKKTIRAHFPDTRKSIPSRYTACSSSRADSFLVTPRRYGPHMDHGSADRHHRRNHGDRRNNEDECSPEWVDREIARRRGIRTRQRNEVERADQVLK